MVVKVALAMLAVAFIISVAMVVAFLYFRDTAKMQHEKEMERIERDEKLFEHEFSGDSIDTELERENNK